MQLAKQDLSPVDKSVRRLIVHFLHRCDLNGALDTLELCQDGPVIRGAAGKVANLGG